MELLAKRGKKTVTVATTGYCTPNDTTTFSGVVVVSGYVIPFISSGCFMPDKDSPRSHRIDDLFKPKAKKKK